MDHQLLSVFVRQGNPALTSIRSRLVTIHKWAIGIVAGLFGASHVAVSGAGAVQAKGGKGPIQTANSLESGARPGPYFDKAASKNVTALLGKTAYLNCKVKNLGNKSVSWVRHRDIHLLTVGRYTYTSDQRFRAIHHQSSEDWSLQVKYPQHRDSGIYECQISTTPHMSHYIHLNVVVMRVTQSWIINPGRHTGRRVGMVWFTLCLLNTNNRDRRSVGMTIDRSIDAVISILIIPPMFVYNEPTTDIIGGPDLFIDRGSTINLTCVVLYSPEPPAYIFWNHNDAIISYDSPRGGVSVITEKGETTVSFLLIQQAKPTDNGRYQCNPSNAQSKSINVHVLNEFPAAMQHGGQAHHRSSHLYCLIFCVCLLLLSP
ncbi:hypothetical protein J6590_056080 [Homalodisca vitripennis]|nr:hypothetical protein J6590_056080 [Homalodisca vitripennis]